MALKTIFPEQTLSFVPWVEAGNGMYKYGATPAPFTLEVGETYVYYFDGDEYTQTAFAADGFAPGAVGLGNPAFVGGEADPEGRIFIIGYLPDTNYCAVATISTDSTHTLAINKVVEGEEKIILRKPDGTPEEYAVPQMLELDTTEGGTVLYSKGQTLETVPVTLDFSSGEYQHVVLPDGYLAKSAVIAKPTNLVPENIAKDVDVAGVVGTLEAGGSGESNDGLVWTLINSKAAYISKSTGVSATITMKIPANNKIIHIHKEETQRVGSSNTALNTSNPINPTYRFDDSYWVTTEQDGCITYTATNYYNTASNKNIWVRVGMFIEAVFNDLYTALENGVNVLRGKPSLSCLPAMANGYEPVIHCSQGFEKVDLTGTSITSYEKVPNSATTKIKTVIVPISCATIGERALYGSVCTKVGNNENTADNTVDLPYVTEVKLYGLYSMSGIQYMELDSCETLETYACYGCSSLISVKLPSIKSIGQYCFQSCSKLQVIDMTDVTAVPALGNSYAIPKNAGLEIRVPAVLYDEWIAATNWSNRADYIVAV